MFVCGQQVREATAPGAGPNKSAHVGEYRCQCADVNRARSFVMCM